MAKPIELRLPWPPTTNHFHQPVRMGKFIRLVTSKKAKDYKKEIIALVHEYFPNLETRTNRLAACVSFYPPTRRKCDLANFEKALFDGLGEAGVFEDDSQFDCILFLRGEVVKGGQVAIRIFDFEDDVVGLKDPWEFLRD